METKENQQDVKYDEQEEKLTLFVSPITEEEMRKNYIKMCIETDYIERNYMEDGGL